jgi:RNA polymerase sigma-70 factor (ECF subfamily)
MAASLPQSALDSTITLVTRARRGDLAALESIVGRYQPALTRFAHGRVPASARGLVDTCDVVQSAIINTLARLDSIDVTPRGSLLAYLRRAVLNLVRDQIRRAQRRPATGTFPLDLVAGDRDPLDDVIGRETLERYEWALTRLPADQQEAFLMRMEMDCGYREIAEALGRPTAESARMLVRRAVEALAVLLKESAAP